MDKIAGILSQLPERHRIALEWFLQNRGKNVPWPKAFNFEGEEILLLNKAKGIYKPQWSKYALSVRQSLGGKYPDQEPVRRPDGTWLYAYFQENSNPASRDLEFTNAGLLECLKDHVPVGVVRQISPKPNSRYEVLGLAVISGWEDGFFFLEGVNGTGEFKSSGSASEIEFLEGRIKKDDPEANVFNPSSVIDARERILAQIVRRRGQSEFRNSLIEAYAGCCAITGCNVSEALEAAHITPYKGAATNALANGILLRADLHTLFDLGLISVSPETFRVVVAYKLRCSPYSELHDVPMRLPLGMDKEVLAHALAAHLAWSGILHEKNT